MANNKVYDRGSRLHARGKTSNGRYIVAADDTFYSIGLRFGVPWKKISEFNGIYGDKPSVLAGTPIIIPGLVQRKPPVVPPVRKPPTYKPRPPQRKPATKPPTGAPLLGMISPTHNSFVYASYTVVVHGTSRNLRGRRIIVRVKNLHGSVLVQKYATVDSAGKWHVEFRNGLLVQAGTDGIIEAEALGSSLRSSVTVHFR